MKNHEALKINIELIASEPIKHSFALFKNLSNENEKQREEKKNSEQNLVAAENDVQENNDQDQRLFFGVNIFLRILKLVIKQKLHIIL